MQSHKYNSKLSTEELMKAFYEIPKKNHRRDIVIKTGKKGMELMNKAVEDLLVEEIILDICKKIIRKADDSIRAKLITLLESKDDSNRKLALKICVIKNIIDNEEVPGKYR